MLYIKKTLALLVAVTVVANLQGQTSSGTRFWIGFGENIDLLFNGDPSFSVIAAADEAFSGTVSVPQTGLTIDFSSDPGVLEVPLPDAIWYAEVDQVPINKGILVETDVPVHLTAIHYRVYFSDGSRILSENALSDEYMAVAADDTNENGDSQLIIVATEDDTEVEVTPSVLTTELSPPGIPFTVTLDAGQIYQIKSADNLSGTEIRTLNGSKLAVFSGASQAAAGCPGEDNHHWDQVLPRSLCGTEYPLVPYLSQGTNDFRVVAFDDDTEVFLNCETEVVLNAGESHVISLSTPALLDASNDVAVAQLAYSSDCSPGNSGSSFSILHPLALRSSGTGFRFSDDVGDQGMYFSSHSLTVIKNSTDNAGVNLNGSALSFSDFPGNPGLQIAQFSSAAGDQVLETTGNFWASAASFGSFDACTYALGFDTLVTDADEVELLVAGPPISDELCSGIPVNFSYLFEGELTDLTWDFGDGSGVSNELSPDHIYAAAGTYVVTFTAFDGTCPVSGSLEVEIIDCGTFVSGTDIHPLLLQRTHNGAYRLEGIAAQPVRWALYDLTGEQIERGEEPALPTLLQFNHLSDGVYLFTATDGMQSMRLKVNLTSR